MATGRVSRWVLPMVSACSLLVLAGVAGAEGGARSGADGALTLRDAAEVALRSHPLVQVALSGEEAAGARLREARSGWLPTVQVTETITRSNNPVFAFGSLLEQARFGPENFGMEALNNPAPLTNFRTAASVSYPVFDQFQTRARIAQGEWGEKTAGAQRSLVEQRVRFDVIRTYYGALVADAQVSLSEEAVRTAEADRARVADRYENGLVVHSDLLATEVQLAEFRQQAIQASGERATAYAALNAALGLTVNAPRRLSGALSERAFAVSPPEELLRQALENRPDYVQARLAVQSASESERAARAQYLPRVDLFASYGGSAHEPGIDSTDYSFGAGLTFNVLSPGRGSRIQQARSAVSIAEAERQQAANRLGLEVAQAYNHYTAARSRLEVAKQATALADEALRIVQERYGEGLTTITEVLRAETALNRIRLNALAARYEYYVGYAQVLVAAGLLKDVGPFES